MSGGGTGGHIYPAIALINYIKTQNPECEFLYIGTEKGLEKTIVEREGIPFEAIEITGFKRKISLDNAKTILRFLKGTSRCKKLIKNFKPDAVLGTGGYVCGPVVYAASKLKVPTVIHEQNSVPGLTNKFLSRYVDKIALSFEQAKDYFPTAKTVLTGNPRAQEVVHYSGKEGIQSVGLDPQKKSVLIVGGSRGARPINNAFLNGLSEAAKREYQFLYITGDVHYEEVQKEVNKNGGISNVIVKPFIHNMPEVLSGIDLIVARAGATTLAEITSLGLPSILIPSPYVTNNHQEKNARALSDQGAAIIRLESELNSDQLLKDIDDILLNPIKNEEMRNASRDLGIQDAAARLYKEITSLNKVRD